MDKLPSDIKKYIWEFVGKDVLQTPTGKIMKDFIHDFPNCFMQNSELEEWYFENNISDNMDVLWDEYMNSNFVKRYLL
jgi:hypothetical protein